MADGATDVIAEALLRLGLDEDRGGWWPRDRSEAAESILTALSEAGLVVVREADQLTAEDLIVAESWGADRKAWEDEGAGIDWTLSDQTALVNLRRRLADRKGEQTG